MYNGKKVSLIIPTRYNSERFGGKVLKEIAGKKQIEIILERANESKYIDDLILAISDEQGKEIEEWFKIYSQNNSLDKRLCTWTGNHNDITHRCLEAAEFYLSDIIVDTSHCCTFFDPNLTDFLIHRLFEYNADYSANCITRSFPDGFDIQVYTKEIYQKTFSCENRKNFWTGWNIWHCRQETKARIINLEAEKDFYFPEWRLTFDTEKDFQLIEKIVKFFGGDMRYVSYTQIIGLLKSKPDWLSLNSDIEPTKIED